MHIVRVLSRRRFDKMSDGGFLRSADFLPTIEPFSADSFVYADVGVPS